MSSLVKGRPAFISTHLTGTTDFNFLFLVGLENISQISTIDDVFLKLSRNLTVEKRSYDKVTISDIHVKGGRTFSYTLSKGILIGSFSSILVEDAIRQLNSGNSLADKMKVSPLG